MNAISAAGKTLRFEKSVGRVGALAVALGVGVGLSASLACGVAHASGPDSTSTSSDHAGQGNPAGHASAGTSGRSTARAGRGAANADNNATHPKTEQPRIARNQRQEAAPTTAATSVPSLTQVTGSTRASLVRTGLPAGDPVSSPTELVLLAGTRRDRQRQVGTSPVATSQMSGFGTESAPLGTARTVSAFAAAQAAANPLQSFVTNISKLLTTALSSISQAFTSALTSISNLITTTLSAIGVIPKRHDGPTAVNDSGVSTVEDTALTLSATQLVGNDTDVEGGALSVASVSGAVHGTAVLNGDGTVTFTPTANYNGSASFTYQVKEFGGAVSANSATVSITVTPVNDAPTAVNDTATTPEDAPVTINVLGNDTDPDAGDTLSVASVSGAIHGTAVLNANGTVTFTPTTDYNGAASFTYNVKDAAGAPGANTATVSVTVTQVNDAPTAVNDSGVSTAEDTALTLSATQLVGNDTDVEGGTLSVASVSGATHGTAVLNANGTVTFTPATDYNGAASFTYQVKDSAGAVSANSASVAVTVTPVNDAPTAVNDSGVSTAEDAALTLSAAQLVGNDTDVDGGALSVASVSGAAHGTAVLNGDGTVTFTPVANYNGAASFTYQVKDSAGAVSANAATVAVTVTPVNDPPTAVNDSGVSTAEDTALTLTAAQLVGNDTDAEGGTLSVASVSGAAHGTAVLNANGTVTFTPATDYNGAASFTYQVKDSGGAVSVNSATVALTVTAVNDAPVVDGATTPVVDHTTGVVTIQVRARDIDGDTLTYSIAGGASKFGYGTVTIDSATGVLVFTPTANARQQASTQAPAPLTDAVSVVVTDTHGATASEAVSITVDPTAPVVSGVLSGTWYTGETAVYTLTKNINGGYDVHSADPRLAFDGLAATLTESAPGTYTGAFTQGYLDAQNAVTQAAIDDAIANPDNAVYYGSWVNSQSLSVFEGSPAFLVTSDVNTKVVHDGVVGTGPQSTITLPMLVTDHPVDPLAGTWDSFADGHPQVISITKDGSGQYTQTYLPHATLIMTVFDGYESDGASVEGLTLALTQTGTNAYSGVGSPELEHALAQAFQDLVDQYNADFGEQEYISDVSVSSVVISVHVNPSLGQMNEVIDATVSYTVGPVGYPPQSVTQSDFSLSYDTYVNDYWSNLYSVGGSGDPADPGDPE